MAITFFIFSVVFLVVFIGWQISGPAYSGPETDHFDGKKFHNRDNFEEKTTGDLFKWMFSREQGKWTELSETEATYGPPPAAKVEDSTQVITYINHSTFLIQTDGLNILTDPVYSERVSPFSFAGPKRMRPPGIKFDDLPAIDVILISHNHYDHLDINTLKRLDARDQPEIIVPLGVDLYLRKEGLTNVTTIDWWEETEVNDQTTISAVEAQHFSSRGMFDRDKTLWAGYVIHSENGNIYFAGDSGYNVFFKEIGEKYAPIKTALIPVGAYKPEWFMGPVHLSPYQALQVHNDLNAELSIGMHFGTFPLADDGQNEPIDDFNKVRTNESFVLLKEGEAVER